MVHGVEHWWTCHHQSWSCRQKNGFLSLFSGFFFPHIHTIEEHYGHTRTNTHTHKYTLYISLSLYTHTQHRHTGWCFDIFIFLPEMMIKTISRRSTSQMVARIRITTLWYRTFQVGEFEFFSITLWSCILVFADSASCVNQDYGKINSRSFS